MQTETTKLTIRLPRQHVEFAKEYARTHGLTVTEVIDRYLRQIQALEDGAISPELETITGLVPTDVDARETYRQHLTDKHR